MEEAQATAAAADEADEATLRAALKHVLSPAAVRRRPFAPRGDARFVP